jgi:anti-sigma factor RsiW
MNTPVPPDANPPPDDQRLSAWLDGELDPVDHADVSAWLRRNPDQASRVRQWRADRDNLRALFGPVVEEPLPEAMVRAVQGRHDRHAPWRRVALVAGLMVTGALGGGALGLGWGANHPELTALWSPASAARPTTVATGGWTHRAAVAHVVYTPEVKHPVEVNVAQGSAEEQHAQEEHLARWLTKRLGMPVRLFDLRSQGWQLVGGRLLPDAAGPSAQLMYQDAAGERVTLYLRRPEPGTQAAFRYERDGELGLFYWMEDGFGYALVGKLPREQLLAVAQSVYQQSEAPPKPVAAPASAP